MPGFSEADWELVALETLGEHGWQPLSGADIAPGKGERTSWEDPVIPSRVVAAVQQLNPQVPQTYLKQAVTEILTPRSQDAIAENKRLHEYMVNGYRGVTWTDHEGIDQNPTIRLIDPRPERNEWLAVNQVTVRNRDRTRRLDVVLYCNGLPVAIMELKNAGTPSADLAMAHAQLGTYVTEFPMAFRACVVTVISDGIFAAYGTPFTPLNHYSPWNVDDEGHPVELGEAAPDTDHATALEIALDGLFNLERFTQLMRLYVAFAEGEHGLSKRIAKPHQYFAVAKAIGTTIQAVRTNGKAGVVWHTQGSGKSLEMELYANQVARRPELLNPTLVVITDRTELDGQLYDGFAASTLLPEKPVQVRKRSELRSELSGRTSGGIYFTTLQKFGRSAQERQSGAEHPLLSDRRNIIIIVDEAHRSHYDDLDGYARHLHDAVPNATFIAFTGTPISKVDHDTREVFGDYIDIYDLTRAVADGAIVPVYFEPRLVKVGLAAGVTQEQVDEAADEATAGLDDVERERIEQSVAVINAVYGAPDRLARLGSDIVEHWETRSTRMRPFIDGPGKAMIVGSTRQICADLYAQIVALRPDWHDDAVDKGRIKVVYSGSAADQPPVSDHVRRESQNKVIKARLRDPDDELELVIVKDMMLTGYDSPPLHTLYLDRPLKGALLMQTLARINRTFRGKEDGLLVAYAPLAENLAAALAEYTLDDQKTKPVGRDVSEAVELARALVGQLNLLTSGYDWRAAMTGPKGWIVAATGLTAWLRAPGTPGNKVPEGEASLGERYRSLAGQLSRAWALASGSEMLADIKVDVRFYEEVRIWMAKFDAAERAASGRPIPEEVARLLRQIVDESTSGGEVVDIYQAAQISRPNFDHLSPDLLSQAKTSSRSQLAIEALRNSILAEAERVTGHNLVRQRNFSDRLASLMTRYTNSQLTAAEVLQELYEMSKDIAAESRRGEQFHPPLGANELSLYDAVADNQSAMDVLGQDVLADIARELVRIMRKDTRTDWTVRDDVRAALRAKIKRVLRSRQYPPDKSEQAVHLVIEQMEVLAPGYSGSVREHIDS